MLILVGVTINVAINGGLITVTQEAKFKTEVRQIQEGLQVRKTVLLAENLGTLENISSITIDELDIEQKLKTKFAQKLIILKRADDFVLCYNPQNVTNQEKIWLEELNIFGTSFIEDVTEATSKNFDETFFWNDDAKISGIRDLQAIHQDLKAKYPDAIFAYTYMLNYNDSGLITFSSEEYRQIVENASDYTALYNYAKETGKETIEESDLTSEMLIIAEELSIKLPVKVSTLYSGSTLYRNLFMGTITLNVFYEDEHIYIGAHPELEEALDESFSIVKEKIKIADIMKKEEVEKVLYLEKMESDEVDNGFGKLGLPLEVVGYEPNSYNITVPAYVVNSDNEMEVVQGIATEAFAMDSSAMTTKPNKLNVIKMIQIEENMDVEHYTDLSLEELKTYMSMVTGGKSDTIKDSYVEDAENAENNKNIKKAFVKEALGLMMNISKDELEQYFVEEDGIMYAMMTFDTNGAPSTVYKIKDENGNLINIEYVQPIGNLTLKEGITKIEERAFAGNILYTINLPTTIKDATNAFTDINTIYSIKWNLSMDEIRKIEGYNTGDGQFGLDGYVSDYLN